MSSTNGAGRRRLTDSQLRRLAVATFAVVVVSFLVDMLVPLFARAAAGQGWQAVHHSIDVAAVIITALPPIVGVLIAHRQPRNAVGWILLAVGVVAWLPLVPYYEYALDIRPGSLPAGRIVAAIEANSWVLIVGLMGMFLILLFPDGHLPAPRWRWVGWVAGITTGYIYVAATFTPGKLSGLTIENPLGISVLGGRVGDLILMSLVIVPISIGLCAAGLVARFRHSSGTERQQLKWLTTAGAAVAVGYGVALVATVVGGGDWAPTDPAWMQTIQVVGISAFVLIPVSIGVAILKHGLYDIDLVINKTLVFGLLAAFITAVYVAVVVGLGHLIGSGDRPNLALSVAATAIVAVAFEPVRDRLQRIANRLVYGERATPYEVLSDFADRMGGAYDATELLPLMARTVGRGVEAAQVQVWLRHSDGFDLASTWTADDRTAPGRRLVPTLDEVTGDRVVPVNDRGELLGAVALVKPAGKELTPIEEGLLDTLAAQAGPVLRNVRLIEDLRSSRQRLVATQDDERRRLERNLHDGAQQSLVAVALMLRLVQPKVATQEERAGASLEQAAGELGHAIEELRELARGIYPVVLTERGLGAALSSLAERLPVPVVVDDQVAGRVSSDIERALYFVAFEALTSSGRAGAREAAVDLDHSGGVLKMRVDDDGAPANDSARGLTLQGLLDRAAVVDADLAVETAATTGLHLTCTVHLPTVAAGASLDDDTARPSVGAAR